MEARLAGFAFVAPWSGALVVLAAVVAALLVGRAVVDPLLSATAVGLVAGLALCLVVALAPGAAYVSGQALRRLRVERLSRKEPRLLRVSLWLAAATSTLSALTVTITFYDSTVWPAPWSATLVATCFAPPALSMMHTPPLSRALSRSTRALAALALGTVLVVATFSSLHRVEGARLAVLDSEITLLAPTLASVVHRLTDRDGDGYSAILDGGDLDDTDRAVSYRGAPGAEREQETLLAAIARTSRTSPPPEATQATAPREHNLVLIVVDALRPDHVGAYGYERDTTPHMDALAAQSVLFERAYAQSPHTPRSIPSLFCSLAPEHLDLVNAASAYPLVHESNLTLFEVLDDAGFRNVAVTSHYYFAQERGLAQGFHLWDNRGARGEG